MLGKRKFLILAEHSWLAEAKSILTRKQFDQNPQAVWQWCFDYIKARKSCQLYPAEV
jgi:hypothetical protein